MGEHLPCKQGVKGSIPFVSTIPFFENRIGKKRGKAAKAALQRHREKSKVKIVRAYGGCLGAKSRRRTRLTAKSFGEP